MQCKPAIDWQIEVTHLLNQGASACSSFCNFCKQNHNRSTPVVHLWHCGKWDWIRRKKWWIVGRVWHQSLHRSECFHLWEQIVFGPGREPHWTVVPPLFFLTGSRSCLPGPSCLLIILCSPGLECAQPGESLSSCVSSFWWDYLPGAFWRKIQYLTVYIHCHCSVSMKEVL